MKMTRTELKEFVRSIMLELLTEGLAMNKKGPPPLPRQVPDRKVRPFLPTESLKRAVIKEAGGNPVMASILADTAANSLPKMLAGERGGVAPASGGAAELAVANSTPEELFGGDAASRWADLAFDDTLPKKTG